MPPPIELSWKRPARSITSPPDAPPFLIVRGTPDEAVPYEQSERLHAALQAAGAKSELLPIEGGHHNLQPDPGQSYDGQVWYDVGAAAIDFFDRHLRRP